VLEECTAAAGSTNLNRIYNWGLTLISQSTRAMGNQPSSSSSQTARLSTLLMDNSARWPTRSPSMRYGLLITSNACPDTLPLHGRAVGTLIWANTTKEAHVGRGHRQVPDHGQVEGTNGAALLAQVSILPG